MMGNSINGKFESGIPMKISTDLKKGYWSLPRRLSSWAHPTSHSVGSAGRGNVRTHVPTSLDTRDESKLITGCRLGTGLFSGIQTERNCRCGREQRVMLS